MANPMRIAMLISGGGTTMKKIVEDCQEGELRGLVEPAVVIAGRPDAGGIAKAQAAGVPTVVLERDTFGSGTEFGRAIIEACKRHRAIFIGQYGWLSWTPRNVIEAFPGMMVNQHPAPLDPGRPDFGGKGMYGRAAHAARLYFARRTKGHLWTEATAQRVHVRFDQGAVLGRQMACFSGSFFSSFSSVDQLYMP